MACDVAMAMEEPRTLLLPPRSNDSGLRPGNVGILRASIGGVVGRFALEVEVVQVCACDARESLPGNARMQRVIEVLQQPRDCCGVTECTRSMDRRPACIGCSGQRAYDFTRPSRLAEAHGHLQGIPSQGRQCATSV